MVLSLSAHRSGCSFRQKGRLYEGHKRANARLVSVQALIQRATVVVPPFFVGGAPNGLHESDTSLPSNELGDQSHHPTLVVAEFRLLGYSEVVLSV